MNYSLIPPVITYAMRGRRNTKETEHDKDGTHEQRRLKLDQGHAWLSWDPLESGACRSISLRNGITWIFTTLAVACVMEYPLFQHNVNKSYNLVSHLLQNIPSKTYDDTKIYLIYKYEVYIVPDHALIAHWNIPHALLVVVVVVYVCGVGWGGVGGGWGGWGCWWWWWWWVLGLVGWRGVGDGGGWVGFWWMLGDGWGWWVGGWWGGNVS